MLYMVEMDLPDRSEIDRWQAWYDAHIAKLLKVPGYHGAQRFEAVSPTPSPFLAIHNIDAPELFESSAYRAVGGPTGTGEWRTKMTNWHRNLFEGYDDLRELGFDERLAFIAADASLPDDLEKRVTWLSNAGLDQSIFLRGLIIFDAGEDTTGLADRTDVVIYRPITAKFTELPGS
jgi:hypothetical protein